MKNIIRFKHSFRKKSWTMQYREFQKKEKDKKIENRKKYKKMRELIQEMKYVRGSRKK